MSEARKRPSIISREAEVAATCGGVVISSVGAFHAGDSLFGFTIDCHANSPWVLATCATHSGAIPVAGVLVHIAMFLTMTALAIVSLRRLVHVVLDMGPPRPRKTTRHR